MKTGILGLLAGTFLFVGGFLSHDDNYSVSAVWRGGNVVSWDSDDDNGENLGYVAGTVGAAIVTLSVKRLLNQQKPKANISKKSMDKFRLTFQFFAGAGLWESGLWLHELGKIDDQVSLYTYEDRAYSAKGRDDIREHLGFAVGAFGASVFAYSAKQLWDSQGQEQDLDRAYRQFRIKLGMRGQD